MTTDSDRPAKPSFEIRTCQHKDEAFKDAYEVRVKVFVDEQQFSADDEPDHYDPISTSLILYVHSEPVGTVRYTPTLGKVSRLAVLKDYRSYGFGKELMLALEQHAKAHGQVDGLYAHSQIHAIPFYERLGYSPEGERFDEDGAPHQKMVKSLVR